MVLLHAFGLTPAVYQRTIDLLGRRVRVIAPWWLRVRSRTWTLERAWACLECLLDDEDVQDAVLIGHSFGGAIAAGYAARHPERVSHLVLANALVLSPGKRELSRLGLPGRHWLVMASGRGAAGFFEMVAARPRNIGRAAMTAYRTDLRDEVATIRDSDIRSTVLWSPEDALLHPDQGVELAAALDGMYHKLPHEPEGARVDHDWVFRRPGLFARTLDELGIIEDR